ncbi:ATP-grasp domain-containing protein [Salinispora arenicola]|uniref:ATP-grasp domain-containing protein n=1 Tax=Salinispora arenicola TaxID=168697 RepID=UPI00035CF5C5|nr:ATP-grasp domain-containing protein [Salinispora arenicola]
MTGEPESTDRAGGADVDDDERQLAAAVANFFRDRRLVVVSSRAAMNAWLLDFFRVHSLPMPFLVLGDTNGVPEDVPCHEIEVVAESIDDWLRALEEQLLSPSAGLLAALDGFDPDRRAVVLAPPLSQGVDTVVRRRCFGWRRPAWVRYEDKTVNASVWNRAGVPAVPSTVVDFTPERLASAFDFWDSGAGVVVSADASEGLHSGSARVIRARDRAALERAHAFLSGRCRQAVVAAFTEGMSCTIHGMVFEKDVAAYRPIEQVILHDDEMLFPLLGGNAQWRPSEEDIAAARAMVRRVGEQLRDEAGYRGSFGVDAILTADGFRAIEINARMGGFIVNGGPAGGVPLDLIHAMVAEGEEAGIDPAALERVIVRGFDSVPGTSLVLPLRQDVPDELRPVYLRHAEGGYRTVGTEDPHDAVVRYVRTPVGGRVLLDFPARPFYAGVPLGPFAIAAIEAVTRAWRLPAATYGYATVVR